MASNTTEIAGNYAMSGGSGDPSFVAEQLDKLQSDRNETANEQLDAAEMEATVESREVEYGTIDVAGEEIAIEHPLGVGRRCRITREAIRADEHGDGIGQLDTVLEMVDALNDATADRWGLAFWDELTDEQLRGAFEQLTEQSKGGANAGN